MFAQIFRAVGASVLVITGGIGVFLAYQSIPTLRHYGLGFFTTRDWNPGSDVIGIAAVLVSTVVIALVALVIAFPLALATACYITEYAPPRLRATLIAAVDLMAAIPSIVYGLWGGLDAPGGGLSGGQQQRLCIARSMAIKPRVLLMDEPCSALDPTSTRVIEETMKYLAEEVTIVIVTHDMQQAARVSDQTAFFLASHNTPGAIVEYGDTVAMFQNPQDSRTYDYVNGRFG